MKLSVNQLNVKKLTVGLVGFFLTTIILTIIFGLLTINQLKTQEFHKASQSANLAKIFLQPIKVVTFNKPNDIQIVDNFFSAIGDLPEVITTLQTIDENQKNQFIFDLSAFSQTFELPFFEYLKNLSSLLEKPSLVKSIIDKDEVNKLKQAQDLIIESQIILSLLTKEQQKWLLVFQNSNELRPTGGFMGSYAIIDINEGKVVDIVVEDIFDADGQFEGYISAPAGVYEYLSSGRGMRLPDSNWHPDTAESAKEMLKFFAYGNRQNIRGVVFVNLDLARTLLEFTGPIKINDYNTLVTSDNIDSVLRSGRDDFFPGSTQKKHLISQLLSQIQIRLLDLSVDKKIELAKTVTSGANKHNLQFYSTIPEIDDFFVNHSLRQELSLIEEADYLYLVEANVGINKANKNVIRKVFLDRNFGALNITVEFENTNTKSENSKIAQLLKFEELDDDFKKTENEQEISHLAYINYQRVIFKPEWKISQIYYKDKSGETNTIENWDEDQIEDKSGKLLNQVGFLVVVPEASKRTLVIELMALNKIGGGDNLELVKEVEPELNQNQIYIQKQPGIPPVLYTITTPFGSKVIEVGANMMLDY